MSTKARLGTKGQSRNLTPIPLMQIMPGFWASKTLAACRNYPWSEYAKWLEEVGFNDLKRFPIESPGTNGILVGRKP